MELNIIGERIKKIQLFGSEFNAIERVDILCENTTISIGYNQDNEELVVSTEILWESRDRLTLSNGNKYNNLIGKRIFCYWLSNNEKGYQDLFVLGIEELLPTFMISCCGGIVVRIANEITDDAIIKK